MVTKPLKVVTPETNNAGISSSLLVVPKPTEATPATVNSPLLPSVPGPTIRSVVEVIPLKSKITKRSTKTIDINICYCCNTR